jgi:predicted transcriptional regulator YheO
MFLNKEAGITPKKTRPIEEKKKDSKKKKKIVSMLQERGIVYRKNCIFIDSIGLSISKLW